MDLATAGPATAGAAWQLEDEALYGRRCRTRARYQVTRGLYGSTATAHAASTPVFALQDRTSIAPFLPNFSEARTAEAGALPLANADCQRGLLVTNAR